MPDYIYSESSLFVSVAQPYLSDRWVKANFRHIDNSTAYIEKFATFFAQRPLLNTVLSEIAKQTNASQPIRVVDCGVFMGIFTIAANLAGKKLGLALTLSAYEANALMVGPIRENFAIYDTNATVHNNGIGEIQTTVDFVFRSDAMIGGTVKRKPAANSDAHDTQTVTCDILPLDSVIADDHAAGLIKIDIEGNEVPAFRTIAKNLNKLNNVFIVEYAPYQGKQKISDVDFDTFLLANFEIFDVGSWLYARQIRRLRSVDDLENCLTTGGNRPSNTDILLIPRTIPNLINRLIAMAAPTV